MWWGCRLTSLVCRWYASRRMPAWLPRLVHVWCRLMRILLWGAGGLLAPHLVVRGYGTRVQVGVLLGVVGLGRLGWAPGLLRG